MKLLPNKKVICERQHLIATCTQKGTLTYSCPHLKPHKYEKSCKNRCPNYYDEKGVSIFCKVVEDEDEL